MTAPAWTSEQTRLALQMHAERHSTPEIAAAVGRSAYAVQSKLRQLDCYASNKTGREDRGVRYDHAPLPLSPGERFEDDPRACRREAPWRGEPAATRSPVGCATALFMDAIGDSGETERAKLARQNKLINKRRYYREAQQAKRVEAAE